MSILQRLYMGNLFPFEESIPHNTDYRLLSNKIGEEREYFEGILSPEEKERFKAWNEMMFRYEDITSYENKAGLSKEQSTVVDKVISAANDCGTAYGAVACRLGLQDGIRLASEMKEFE